MTYQPAPAPTGPPSRPGRRWVHAVPAVMIIAVLAVAAIAGIAAFVEANGDSVTRPAAPFQAILVGGIWLVPAAATGIFLTSLAYLLVLPARSLWLRIPHIVLTGAAAALTVAAIMWFLPALART